MAGRIIEIAIFIISIVAVIAIAVIVPLDSYNQHKDYLAQIEEQNKANEQAAMKPVLESITVELKEGIRYFANDLASPKAEHFNVVANYSKGEEKYSEPVEESKFNISVPVDFYSKGGTVKITFKGATESINFKLEPVVIDKIEVVSNPYTIKYVVGSTFDATGMIIKAIYNDGSYKILTEDDYKIHASKSLTTDDKEVVVSYTIGGVTKVTEIAIGVSETLNDGAVTDIVLVDKATINAGDVLTNASVEVNAIYESGNRKPLSRDEYTITGSSEDAAKFGKTYDITVVYNKNNSMTAKTGVIVLQTLQGEHGVIVGGKSNTETEYIVVDGVFTQTSNKVSFAGGFDPAVNRNEDAYVILNFSSDSATVGNITMRCSNSYCVKYDGGGYIMQPLQINTIIDLTINGREVQIPASVVLKGCGPNSNYGPLYGVYYDVVIEDVPIDAGVNYVKFDFKKSTTGAVNAWGDTLGTLNIDYVSFSSIGNDIPDNYQIEKIQISDALNITYKQSIDSLTVPVIATINGGLNIQLDPDLYDVNITGGDEGDTYFRPRTYKIEVSLKSDPSVKAIKEYTVQQTKSFAVLNAYVELDGDKVYYVFTGTSTGYAHDDFVFVDEGQVYDMITFFDDETFIFKIDVTELSARTIYPHMKVEGNPYANGAKAGSDAAKNGDIIGNGLTFTNGQSVTINGKTYTISKKYDMPALVIN